ncbi:MAG: glycosyltransferase [Bacteroidia bacterium]
MGKKIIIAVINDLSGDQRIHRIATTLAENGFDVQVVGRLLPDSQTLAHRPYQTHRMKLWFRKGKWFYLEYNLRLFWYLLWQKAAIFNANDLDTLGASFLAAAITGAELIYDSHEYFTEVPELVERPFTRKIWLLLEGWIFPRLKKVYTVNAMIAEIYSRKYGINVGVVRNLPFSREPISQPEHSNTLLYQGALNLGRGIELMIDAMQYLPEYTLQIIGRGDIEAQLKQRIADKKINNVDFRGFIPFESLYVLTTQACLGLSLEEDLGANYRYASPNKIYDYIQANVPVLVSDLPVMRQLVESNHTGEILPVSARTPENLAKRIRSITENTAYYESLKENCRKAARELNWEKEKQVLLAYYSPSNPSQTS